MAYLLSGGAVRAQSAKAFAARMAAGLKPPAGAGWMTDPGGQNIHVTVDGSRATADAQIWYEDGGHIQFRAYTLILEIQQQGWRPTMLACNPLAPL